MAGSWSNVAVLRSRRHHIHAATSLVTTWACLPSLSFYKQFRYVQSTGIAIKQSQWVSCRIELKTITHSVQFHYEVPNCIISLCNPRGAVAAQWSPVSRNTPRSVTIASSEICDCPSLNTVHPRENWSIIFILLLDLLRNECSHIQHIRCTNTLTSYMLKTHTYKINLKKPIIELSAQNKSIHDLS